MSVRGPYPDAVDVLLDIVEPLVGEDRVAGRLPSDWDGGQRWVYAERIGGTDDGLTDSAIVQVACYGEDRTDSMRLSEDVRQAVLSAAATVVGGIFVDDTETAVGPQDIPDLAPSDRRHVSAYRIDLRRQ